MFCTTCSRKVVISYRPKVIQRTAFLIFMVANGSVTSPSFNNHVSIYCSVHVSPSHLLAFALVVLHASHGILLGCSFLLSSQRCLSPQFFVHCSLWGHFPSGFLIYTGFVHFHWRFQYFYEGEHFIVETGEQNWVRIVFGSIILGFWILAFSGLNKCELNYGDEPIIIIDITTGDLVSGSTGTFFASQNPSECSYSHLAWPAILFWDIYPRTCVENISTVLYCREQAFALSGRLLWCPMNECGSQ